jgi:hypothetical protein
MNESIEDEPTAVEPTAVNAWSYSDISKVYIGETLANVSEEEMMRAMFEKMRLLSVAVDSLITAAELSKRHESINFWGAIQAAKEALQGFRRR